MRIALIFNKTRTDTTGIYLERACRQMGIACDHWWLRDIDKIPSTYDLFLRIDHGDDYLVPVPARLRPLVFYAIDTHLPHSWKKIRRIAPQYDLIFCCHQEGARRISGAEWLPLACDWELHRYQETAPVWDVAFVGTDGGVPRKFYLQVLRERYPNSFIGPADYTQLASIYSRARIGFNYSIANDVNMRMFEVLAARALLITNALPHRDLCELGFKDRRHLVLYHSPQEFLKLIDYYLAHSEERKAIAEAGYMCVKGSHTYLHRMKQLLASVSHRLRTPIPSIEQEPTKCESL